MEHASLLDPVNCMKKSRSVREWSQQKFKKTEAYLLTKRLTNNEMKQSSYIYKNLKVKVVGELCLSIKQSMSYVTAKISRYWSYKLM